MPLHTIICLPNITNKKSKSRLYRLHNRSFCDKVRAGFEMGSLSKDQSHTLRNYTLPVNTKPRNVALIELQPMILVDIVWLFIT